MACKEDSAHDVTTVGSDDEGSKVPTPTPPAQTGSTPTCKEDREHDVTTANNDDEYIDDAIDAITTMFHMAVIGTVAVKALHLVAPIRRYIIRML
jgi:hypothetical protein